MKLYPKAHPYRNVEAFVSLAGKLHAIYDQNKDVLLKVDEEDAFFIVKDIDPESDFYFSVKDFSYSSASNNNFEGIISPWNENTNESAGFSANEKKVIEHFKDWIALIRKYNNLPLEPEDSFERKYERDFEDVFEITDLDAETNPFDPDRQIIIYKYLDFIVQKLQDTNNSDYSEVIDEAKDLQKALPDQTKKVVVKRISKILAKIQKKGIKLLLEFYDVAKKELLKKAFNGGIDEIRDLLANGF